MSKPVKNAKSQLPDLSAMRHSCEHVLTMAMLRMWGNKIKAAMGPAIDDGFYFDFDSEIKISEKDFSRIEQEMNKIIKEDLPITRDEMTAQEAKQFFSKNIYQGNEYKHEWLDAIQTRNEKVTVYWMGEKGKDIPDTFVDICAGPHVTSTGKIGAFKLDKIAGAYWHGDEKNPQLQRIYGLCFATEQELKAFIAMREEAKKRDHKKLGAELDLFTFSDLVGSGLPLWTPRGTLLRNLLDDFVWELRQKYGYQKVEIPHITKKELYETSGHWDKFKNELYRITTREGHEFAMKPMNCPHHTQIYARKPHSYRELPVRYANTTMCYRDEQTGELSGLSRVRCITQDDAHVFCRAGQIKQEMLNIWDIAEKFYRAVNFSLVIRLSLHDPAHLEQYLGSEAVWQDAENQIRAVIKTKKAEAIEAVGEAAFYGPKIDFLGRDSLGREWQVATIQLDMNMPERFDLTCINEKGEKERVVMIHAAIMGSIERFLSIIIEHFAGAFPVWLAPVQIAILPVGLNHVATSQAFAKELQARDLRAEADDANESIGKKVRNAEKQKIPYILVFGDKEATGNQLTVRERGKKDQYATDRDPFIAAVLEKIQNKTL